MGKSMLASRERNSRYAKDSGQPFSNMATGDTLMNHRSTQPRSLAHVSTTRPGPPPQRTEESSDPGLQVIRLADMQRAERSMILVRWAAVVFAVVQVLAYRTEPYPPGIEAAALGLAGLLALANLVIWLASRRTSDLHGARILAVAALAADILLASGFVWLYAFDPVSALWSILFILPLEGAIRFGLGGALASWGAITILYLGREIYADVAYGDPFEPESVSFRMGVGLMISLVAGMMARNLTRQRAQVSQALTELRKTDALRSRMVATLAHDVRNPLTTIRGTFKTLSRHTDRLDPSTLAELIRTADRQAERMERLAADLLDLARTEQGRLELDLQDVRLAEALERGLSFVEGHGRFLLEGEPGLTVRADPRRLEQIIVNLADNALRYGEAPFVAAATRGPDAMVDLSFTDHGPGVPPADRALLFEPFRTEADRGSVGLGLAIVKAMAEAQGGSVAYEANEPRGARFRVLLPSAT
jgi:signal transduction histidine kinase